MVTKLTTKERIELLHSNHEKHLSAIMRSYAEQYAELEKKLQEEIKKGEFIPTLTTKRDEKNEKGKAD